MVFPVTTIEGKRYAIFMRNQTLVVDKKTETLLSVAVLLKAGFDVKFVTGTKRDLVTPDGQKIRMIFGDNLWRLPMWSDQVPSGKNIRKIHTIWYVIIPCPKIV